MFDYWNPIRTVKVGGGLGIDESDAIVTENRGGHWTGLGQDIDSRCLDQMSGEFYEFSAWMQVTASGVQPQAPALDIDPDNDVSAIKNQTGFLHQAHAAHQNV